MIGHVPADACQKVRFPNGSGVGTTYLPATSTRRMACGIENPSNTGTACVTPSPESRTIPVVRPEEYLHRWSEPEAERTRMVPDTYRDNTAWTEIYRAGTLKVSKNICAATSRLCRGFSGASVSNTGCCNRVPFSNSKYVGHSPRRSPTHLFAQRAQLLCIHPVPYSLHVVPVCHDPVLHRVLDLEQSAGLLRLAAYEDVALQRAGHDPYMLWPSDAGPGKLQVSPGTDASRYCPNREGRTKTGRSISDGPVLRIQP